jgi:hypothetical protein
MPEMSQALENHGLSLEKSTRALKPIPLGRWAVEISPVAGLGQFQSTL